MSEAGITWYGRDARPLSLAAGMPYRLRRGEGSRQGTPSPANAKAQTAAGAGLSGVRTGRPGAGAPDREGGIRMANVIRLKSGQCETVFDLEDLLCLVDTHMGDETRRLLEELTAPPADNSEYIEELEQENRELRAHHRAVMRELRTLSETEARLIQEREIDRQALSTVVGKIGTITWREINVG